MKGKIRYKGIASYKRNIYICFMAVAGVLSASYFLIMLTQKTRNALEKVFDVSAVKIVFNDIYSDEVKKNIQSEINSYFSTHTAFSFKFDHFFADLKQQYPMIKDACWQHKSPHKAIMVVSGSLPICEVNHSHMLLRQGVLVDKNVFCDYQPRVPECFVGEQLCQRAEPLSSVVKFVDSFDKQLWRSYEVFYSHDAQIKLIKKDQDLQRGFVEEIVLDSKTLFNAGYQKYIERVVGDLTQKNEFPKKKNSKIVFDLRLHNRILVQVVEPPAMGRKG